jgi:hypothetical protein
MSETYNPAFWLPIRTLLQYFESHLTPEEEKGVEIVEMTSSSAVQLFSTSTRRLAWERVSATGISDHALSAILPSNTEVVFLRHTLEKMARPEVLLHYLKEHVPRGYIETTSVLVECSRGIHHEAAKYCGHPLNRFLVWVNATTHTLTLIPKYAILEYFQVRPEFARRVQSILLAHPHYWNSYYSWTPENPLKFHMNDHGIHFRLEKDYGTMVQGAIEDTLRSINEVLTGVNRWIPIKETEGRGKGAHDVAVPTPLETLSTGQSEGTDQSSPSIMADVA